MEYRELIKEDFDIFKNKFCSSAKLHVHKGKTFLQDGKVIGIIGFYEDRYDKLCPYSFVAVNEPSLAKSVYSKHVEIFDLYSIERTRAILENGSDEERLLNLICQKFLKIDTPAEYQDMTFGESKPVWYEWRKP